MKDIDFLEHGGGGFSVQSGEDIFTLPDPRSMHYQDVLMHIQLAHAPETPAMREWQRSLVFERWCAAWDLPTRIQDATRLAYLVDHYRAPLSFDLLTYVQADLGKLWRERRWVQLLDLIDRLPAHSHYSAAASSDEEHAQMLAEAIIARENDSDKEETGPPLTQWTPEMAVLTSILDAVRGVSYAVVAVQSEKGKAPEPPKPAPRPITPLQRALKRAEFDRRKSAHERLVARLLPHKNTVES